MQIQICWLLTHTNLIFLINIISCLLVYLIRENPNVSAEIIDNMNHMVAYLNFKVSLALKHNYIYF